MNNTHQVLALKLNVCLPPSTLFLELQTHVAKCIYDILLDIQKEIHPLSHQTSPSSCFMDLSRWFFLLPGSPNQRIGPHPRLCPLPTSPTRKGSQSCSPCLSRIGLLFSTLPHKCILSLACIYSHGCHIGLSAFVLSSLQLISPLQPQGSKILIISHCSIT